MRYRTRFDTYLRLAPALFVLLAACSDAPTSPSPAARPSFLLIGAADTLVTRFTFDPAVGGTFKIGDHKLVMPAGSVCDPALSMYGPTEWDRPCVALAAPIEITAKSWQNSNGHPQIDFSPSLRFVPATSNAQWVQLFFRDRSASDAALASQLSIFWSAGPGMPGVDETLTDPTLKVQINTSAGMVWRRIKHFTGYLVTTGYAQQPAEASATLDASVMY